MVEPLQPSSAYEGHVFPAIVCKTFISHTSVVRTVQAELIATRSLVAKLAFGITLDKLPLTFETFKSREQPGERTSGSLFGHEDNLKAFGLPTRAEFELMAGSLIRVDAGGDTKVTAPQAANKYLALLSRAKVALLFLQYVTSPGARASEIATQQALPYSGHESSIRIVNGRLAIRTEINKTGKKYITRYVSLDLVPLFLVVFGPAQYLGGVLLDLLHRQDPTLITNGSDHRVTFHRYMWTHPTGRILDATNIRQIIMSSFERHTKPDRIGAQVFRHFELWIFKEFVLPLLAGQPTTLTLPTLEKSAANHGHSAMTESMRYGNSKTSAEHWDLALSGSSSEDPVTVSLWQITLGITPVGLHQLLFDRPSSPVLTYAFSPRLPPSQTWDHNNLLLQVYSIFGWELPASLLAHLKPVRLLPPVYFWLESNLTSDRLTVCNPPSPSLSLSLFQMRSPVSRKRSLPASSSPSTRRTKRAPASLPAPVASGPDSPSPALVASDPHSPSSDMVVGPSSPRPAPAAKHASPYRRRSRSPAVVAAPSTSVDPGPPKQAVATQVVNEDDTDDEDDEYAGAFINLDDEVLMDIDELFLSQGMPSASSAPPPTPANPPVAPQCVTPAPSLPETLPTEAEVVMSLVREFYDDPSLQPRPGQVEAGVEILRATQDLVVVMPVGGGKTVLSLLPALLSRRGPQERLTVVISPWRGILSTFRQRCRPSKLVVHSYPPADRTVQDRAMGGVLLLSCEQLLDPGCISYLRLLGQGDLIDRYVYDEAHVPSTSVSWRPSIAAIRVLRQSVAPMLLLTATWSEAIERDLASLLHLPNQRPRVYRASLRRANITLTGVKAAEADFCPALLQSLPPNLPCGSKPPPTIVFATQIIDLETALRTVKSHVVGRGGSERTFALLVGGDDSPAALAAQDELYRQWEAGSIDYLFATVAGMQAIDCPVSHAPNPHLSSRF